MDSRRARNIIIVLCILLLLALVFFFFFLKKSPQTPPNNQPGNPFGTSTGNVILPGNGSTTTPVSTSTTVVLSPAEAQIVSGCNSLISVEKDDCIKKAAIENKQPALCAAILGTFGQTDCKNSVTQVAPKPVDVFSKTIASYTFSFGSTPTVTIPAVSSQFSDVLNKAASQVNTAIDNPDPSITAAGFFDRLRTTPLKLFSFSDYQIRPGASVTATGVGFTLTGNDIHIGGFTISNMPSADGMNIPFVMPSTIPEGTYEAWVTNSSGSSRQTAQKIQVVITNNPAPRPIITGVSPAVPGLTDTVTLTGSNLTGTLGLFTSLGVLKKVSSTPSSITFNMADFDLIDKIKDQPNLKGKKLSVSVIVGTPQGYNKDMFVFDVQF